MMQFKTKKETLEEHDKHCGCGNTIRKEAGIFVKESLKVRKLKEDVQEYPQNIIDCIDKLFPKGDKNRGKALVLQAVAYTEGKEQGTEQMREEIIRVSDEMISFRNKYLDLDKFKKRFKSLKGDKNEMSKM